MNKERIIRKIELNYSDMERVLKSNNMPSLIALFREYTDEVIRIIEEELRDDE